MRSKNAESHISKISPFTSVTTSQLERPSTLLIPSLPATSQAQLECYMLGVLTLMQSRISPKNLYIYSVPRRHCRYTEVKQDLQVTVVIRYHIAGKMRGQKQKQWGCRAGEGRQCGARMELLKCFSVPGHRAGIRATSSRFLSASAELS
jgi:hypothetical protein